MLNICDLPEDALVEVLLRVPKETIPRLKCVSKSWRTIINSSLFRSTQKQRTRSIFLSRNNNLLMIECVDPDNRKVIDVIKKKVDVIGTCGGMLCVMFDQNVFIVNPCTKQNVLVPPYNIRQRNECPHNNLMSSFGFGYDDVHDDYKVVKLVHGERASIKIKIYSLRSKYWKNLGYLSYHDCQYKGNAFVKGALHWFLVRNDKQDCVIKALNFATEKFHLVPLPVKTYDFKPEYVRSIGDVDECLSLIYLHDYQLLNIWIMKEYGVQDSWTKFSFQVSSGSPEKLLRSNSDARMMRKAMHSSMKFLVFQGLKNSMCNNNEREVDDLILMNDPSGYWKNVFALYPNFANLPCI